MEERVSKELQGITYDFFQIYFIEKMNKESETGSFSQYDQSEYAKLETKNIVKELNLSDAAQAKNNVVDLCKQMNSGV